MPKKTRQLQASSAIQQVQSPAMQGSVSFFKAASFSGPLPPPEMLRQYNDITPGMADRIMAMAEGQSSHRRDLERKVVYGNERRANLGQWMAFFIALVGIGAGIYLTMNDKPTEGLVTILGPLVCIAGLFVFGKMRQGKQLAAKDRNVSR